MQTPVDLFIVGGGINGAGIAADAAGRGLSVRLCEMNDFASATSSASSKLIHGGLRYLEHYEFRLVREALAERELLLNKAPHLISPMRFVLPHRPHLRPAWMIRSGLFLYDHLAGRQVLQRTRSCHFHEANGPLQPGISKGFEYSDCWVDDARLVIANLMQAQELGAQVDNYTACTAAQVIDGLWHLTLQNRLSGETEQVRARALVNAAGPWAQAFLEQQARRPSPRGIRLIKGSHIIVPKQPVGDRAYILQNEDRRVVFVLPYLEDFTLIGTTDQAYEGDPQQVAINDQEIDYLLDVYNQHFRHPIEKQQVVSHYSGVRPLCDDESDDPSAMTRDYTLELETANDTAPLLSIFGGKITTYRKLAESALRHLTRFFPEMTEAWTQSSKLPGGENFEAVSKQVHQRFHWLPENLRRRWLKAYGSRTLIMLKDVRHAADLGTCFGADLYQVELEYLVRHEWVRKTDDLLQRRSKLTLKRNQLDLEALERALAELNNEQQQRRSA